ncbi:CPCC family cysteine-rich protein [Bacillus sp. FJAT-27251]|uniref:CPCC family cysteine-rich protein n=1 Tax=Bacillus sp. FJAT-27251 TaxID=1684142 RepID=UPI0009E4C758|nr:CPCC family cysteine-rich protein [Bacillus sp. FJAT-27251]
MNYTCPCCGFKTLEEEPPDTFDICEICFWEDGGYQYRLHFDRSEEAELILNILHFNFFLPRCLFDFFRF